MNCKFHPTAEAVTKCAECGAEMCFYCNQKAFFYSEDGKPFCLKCSLEKAERDFFVSEEFLKHGKSRRTIALVLWLIGLPLLALGGFGIFLMLAAAIVLEVEIWVGVASEEKTFTEKIKTFIFGVLVTAVICPFIVIKESNSRKKELKKAEQKYKEVQAATFETWTKDAEKGDACSQYNLGVLYYDGHGVARNYDKAIELWEKAAEQKYTEAMCALGIAYNEGNGVSKDYAKAVEWWSKAASLSDPFAQFALGTCYSEGEGVPKDPAKAAEFYKMAALQGDALAQCALGICYRDGKGVAQDMAKAFEYWKMAAEQGNEKALQLISENS